MRKIELKLSHIQTVGALHIYLQYMLDLPDYYGRNLDALYDVLTENSEPVSVHIKQAIHPSEEMKAYAPRLLRVFCDAQAANPALDVTVE